MYTILSYPDAKSYARLCHCLSCQVEYIGLYIELQHLHSTLYLRLVHTEVWPYYQCINFIFINWDTYVSSCSWHHHYINHVFDNATNQFPKVGRSRGYLSGLIFPLAISKTASIFGKCLLRRKYWCRQQEKTHHFHWLDYVGSFVIHNYFCWNRLLQFKWLMKLVGIALGIISGSSPCAARREVAVREIVKTSRSLSIGLSTLKNAFITQLQRTGIIRLLIYVSCQEEIQSKGNWNCI